MLDRRGKEKFRRTRKNLDWSPAETLSPFGTAGRELGVGGVGGGQQKHPGPGLA